MKKHTILRLILIFVAGIVPVVFLYTQMERQRRQKNAFIRYFPSHILTTSKELDLKVDSYYFAGADSSFIYISNYTNPTVVLKLSGQLTDSARLSRDVWSATGHIWSSARTTIQDASLTLFDAPTSRVAVVQLYRPHRTTLTNIPYPHIEWITTINDQSFIGKRYDPDKNQTSLFKYSTGSTHGNFATYLLQNQLDGHFSVDGQLIRSSDAAWWGYLYYYRNQFIVFDSMLNMRYVAKTIDTNSLAKIHLATTSIHSGGVAVTFADPPLLVNRSLCMTGNFVFVVSALKADNEPQLDFDKNSVVDCYDLQNGIYRFSLYIPDRNGKKLTQILINGKELFVLYDQYLVRFSLALPKEH
jgi:hypothetical protein